MILYYILLCYVLLCYMMLYYGILCYTMWYCIRVYYIIILYHIVLYYMIISYVNPTCRYVQMPTAKLHLGRMRIIEGLTGGIPAFKTRMEKRGRFGFFDLTRNIIQAVFGCFQSLHFQSACNPGFEVVVQVVRIGGNGAVCKVWLFRRFIRLTPPKWISSM